MLVLERKPGQKVVIGELTVTVNRVEGRKVVLGFEAPDSIRILRGELADRAKQPEKDEAA